MTRATNKLSATAIAKRKGRGRLGDGGGLWLNISHSDAKSWVFRWVTAGVAREMGLGRFPDVSLAMARDRAAQCRRLVADGLDPKAERDRENEPTFAECAEMFLAQMEKQWLNEKHRYQWRMTLTDYCGPIRSLRVSRIGTDDVLKVLNPIWQDKHETASRLRGRIERVLDYAKARGWRDGENPALWRGHLKNVLPARQKLTRGHHAAMPYEQLPELIRRLRDAEALSARALEFLILTAARSGEVLGARWDEIDLERKIWTVPAERMKLKKEHRVPLSERAMELLTPLLELRTSEYIFPGQKPGRPLSGMAFAMLMRRMKADQYTPHGFRSAFRDWAGDKTSFQREVAEAALAHKVGDATELAYRRSDALEKRRALMEAWARFCDVPPTSNIILLQAK